MSSSVCLTKWDPDKKKVVKHPGRPKTIHIHPTMRCNLKCSYCSNRIDPANEDRHREFAELPAAQWLAILKHNKCPVIISGGEPLLYRDLVDLINGIPKKVGVHIYSNLLLDVSGLVERVKRPLMFLVGAHPHAGKMETFIRNWRRVASHKNFRGQVCIVDVPENRSMIEDATKSIEREIKRAAGIWHLKIDVDQWGHFPERTAAVKLRRVRCRVDNVLLAPDGVRYPCMSMIGRRKLAMEDAKRSRVVNSVAEAVCDSYGRCCPCDCFASEVELAKGSEYPLPIRNR